MTDNLLKDKNDFNLSIPQHFVNTDPGNFSYTYWSLLKYFTGTGDLEVTLSGEIDQTALDKGINNYSVLDIKSIRNSLWNTINSVGYNQDTSTYFNFLAVTNQINSTLEDGTIVDIPVFFLGLGSGDPAKITINGGTVEIKGQTILDSDHTPNIEIDVENSGTYIIDKAFLMYGNFNINSGTFIFNGDAPDTNTSIVLNDKYGHSQTYKVTKDEVTYNNSNSAGLTYNEDKIFDSTINIKGGSISVGGQGVIFLDHHNTLNLASAKFSGNVILGWDDNTINIQDNFVLNAKSNLMYSGFVDFKSYGFTGDGTFSLFGQYWDGTEYKLSQASIEGGTLGNLNVGFDALYDQGLGGLATTSDTNAPTNKNALYGGSLTISGKTTLEGTVTAGGGTADYASTITLMEGTTITLEDKGKGFVLESDYSYFIAQDSVNFNVLDLQKGTVTLGDKDSFTTLTTEGGTLTASSGTVTGTNLTETGGTLSFDTLVINKTLNVSGGSLKVNNLQDTLYTLNETGSGSIDLEGGNVRTISLNSTANNILNNITVNSLILQAGNSGTTTINGGTYNLLNENGGTLDFAGNATINSVFNLKGKSQTSVEGDLTYNGNAITFSNAGLTMNGGTIDFTGGVVAIVGQGMTVNDKGGTFQLDNSSEISFVNGLEIDGALNLTGSGKVDLYNATTGNGSINVNSGVKLNLEGSSSITSSINLNDGSILDIQDYNNSMGVINFLNTTGKSPTTIEIENEFSNENTTIDKTITNLGTSDRIDFKGINFTNETFQDAFYSGGKLTIDYIINGTTTTREIVLDHVNSKVFTDGETFKIVDDGNGGSEIDFSTGQSSSNHNPLHSMFNAGNDNYVLNNGMSNDNLTNTPNPHTALMKDFSSTLNHIKGMFEPKSLNVTQNQFDQPTTLLGSDMLFKGQNMNTHRELLSHVGKVCA